MADPGGLLKMGTYKTMEGQYRSSVQAGMGAYFLLYVARTISFIPAEVKLFKDISDVCCPHEVAPES